MTNDIAIKNTNAKIISGSFFMFRFRLNELIQINKNDIAIILILNCGKIAKMQNSTPLYPNASTNPARVNPYENPSERTVPNGKYCPTLVNENTNANK